MKLLSGLCIGTMLMIATGCFGGSGSSDDGSNPPPPPPGLAFGGLWSGAVFWDPKDGLPGGALNVRALVAETGEFRFVLYEDIDQYFGDQNEQIFGKFNIVGGDITTIGDAVWAARSNATGDDWASFGMTGDFDAGESLSGEFQANFGGWMHNEERVGTLSMNYHSIYERPSSFQILQGSYRSSDEVLTIDSLGAIFYQSAVNGCTGNGSAEIIDPDFNMYRMTLDVDACTGDAAVRNGLTFSGLANIGENTEPGGGVLNSTLEMALSASIGLPFGQGYVPWSLWANKD